MAEALPFVSISALLVGAATQVIAALAFRHARRSAELAEDRIEYLREEQARLEFLHEERRSLAEELKRVSKAEVVGSGILGFGTL